MIQPSPAPRRRHRIWRGAGIGLAAVLVVAAVAITTFPRWGSGLVHSAIRERLARKLGRPVEIARLELEFGGVQLQGLRVGEPGSDLHLLLERIDVELAEGSLWRARIEVGSARIRGGRLDGQRRAWTELARRLAPRGTADDEPGRVRIVPQRLEVESLLCDITDTERGASVRAWVDGTASRSGRTASVAITQILAELPGVPTLHARQISTTIEIERTETGVDAVFPVTVEIDGAAATLTPEISVAGVRGTIAVSDRDATKLTVDLSGGFAGEAGGKDTDSERLWTLAGDLRRDLTAGALELEMSEFELGRVPDVVARLPLVDSDRATIGGHVSVDFGDGVARLAGDVAVAGLSIEHPLLAADVVSDVGFELSFEAELDPAVPRLAIERARAVHDGVALEVSGTIEHPPQRELRRYAVKASIPEVPCQDMLDAIPADLIPSLQGFALGGKFDMSLELDADLGNLDALALDGHVGIGKCLLHRVPARMAASRLAGPFTHRVTMRDGGVRKVELAPGSSSFTPLSQISPHMVAAVLTTEDGAFYGHRGFLPKQMREALRRNLAAGHVRLGASTISMQMVKNVLLSHERTLSRKLQELFLTWSIEQSLSKDRIMEIYLNVVEFGPGRYGVTQAAEHYFGKHPRELNPLESAYLALMLPSPVRRHVHYCRDGLSPGFDVKLRRILKIMHGRKRISDDDYEQWREGEIVFDPSDRIDEQECLAEVRRLVEASEGQYALSGLLAGGANVPVQDDDEDEDEPLVDIALPSILPTLEPPDPANVDAPGRPAMDPGADGGGV